MRPRFLYLLFVLSLLTVSISALLLPHTDSVQGATASAAAIAAPLYTEEVFIPAGAFGMGCTHDIAPATCDSDAMPLRLVYLNAYYIDKLPVTNAQYAACEAAGACPPPMSITSRHRPYYYGNPTYNSYPVINVEWVHANAYCQWAGKRVPTEAEWEKAARGTDLRPFPWGYELPSCAISNVAVLNPNDAVSDGYPQLCYGDTTPVGMYPQNASPYGVLDMVGNVREWVNDFYVKPYLLQSPYHNPTGPPADLGKGRPVRGGGWYDYPRRATTWVRHDEAEAAAYDTIGFRCAHSNIVEPTPTPTVTPMPTPTPTPVPSDRGNIGPAGGLLWITHPGHLTALHVPSGNLTTEIAFTLTYTRPRPTGELQGMDHFFTVESEPISEPLSVLLGFKNIGGIISNTATLYRLEHSDWVTSQITVTEQSVSHILAGIQQPGLYAILGRTNRLYLPLILKH